MSIFTFNLKLNDFKRGFVDTTKATAEKGVNRGIMYMAGFIRTTSKRSIKNAEKHTKKSQAEFLKGTSYAGEVYSKPGNPPLNKIGLLRDNIFYRWDSARRQAVVGPAKLNGRSNAHEALENGGATICLIRKIEVTGTKTRRWYVTETRYIQARPYMLPALKKALLPKNQQKFFGNLMTKDVIQISAA